MSYDSRLAERARKVLVAHGDVVERRMMGALCFMSGGHMCCGVTGSGMMIRVGRNAYERTLAEPHIRPMKIGSRSTIGFVLVEAAGLQSDAAIARWIQRGIHFVSTLPPKRAAPSTV